MPPRKSSPRIKRPAGTPRRVPQWLLLRVSLAGIEPPIWRSVGVPNRYSLHQLHRVFQLAFGWLDYHQYEFRIGTRRFRAINPEAEGEDARATTLADLSLTPGMTFRYVYDFGDDWVHDVCVDEVVTLPADEGRHVLPHVSAGERAGAPEDVGGPPGYAHLLEALRDPANPRHEELRKWVGAAYYPERFDVWSLNRALQLAAAWGAL